MICFLIGSVYERVNLAGLLVSLKNFFVKQNSDTFDFGARKERSDSMESFHERQQAQKQGRFKIVR